MTDERKAMIDKAWAETRLRALNSGDRRWLVNVLPPLELPKRHIPLDVSEDMVTFERLEFTIERGRYSYGFGSGRVVTVECEGYTVERYWT